MVSSAAQDSSESKVLTVIEWLNSAGTRQLLHEFDTFRVIFPGNFFVIGKRGELLGMPEQLKTGSIKAELPLFASHVLYLDVVRFLFPILAVDACRGICVDVGIWLRPVSRWSEVVEVCSDG